MTQERVSLNTCVKPLCLGILCYVEIVNGYTYDSIVMSMRQTVGDVGSESPTGYASL